MLEGWSSDSRKNFFGQMINSDARALQNLLKMQILDLPRSTLKLPESDIKFSALTCLNPH